MHRTVDLTTMRLRSTTRSKSLASQTKNSKATMASLAFEDMDMDEPNVGGHEASMEIDSREGKQRGNSQGAPRLLQHVEEVLRQLECLRRQGNQLDVYLEVEGQKVQRALLQYAEARDVIMDDKTRVQERVNVGHQRLPCLITTNDSIETSRASR